MRITLGPLFVTIKYTYTRGSTTVYQRSVPTDLRDRYPGATIKQVLKTTDPVRVARLVADLNQKLTREWEGLRAAPEASPTALNAHAVKLLESHGLRPWPHENDPMAVALLHDHADSKRAHFAGGDEQAYRDAAPEDFLTPVERQAGRLLHSVPEPTLTAALEVYLEHNRKRDDRKFTTYARRAFASLVEVTGDKAIAAFTRTDARTFIAAALQGGLKTTTVRRRVNSFRAVWNSYSRECAPKLVNPFESLVIAGEGDDSDEREPYTAAQLETLAAACRAKDDEMRWLVAMLIDTGARLAEVAGLTLDDIKLSGAVPHMVLRPHPWRSLKTDLARDVPLVGVSLWAANRVHQMAAQGQRFAFPRYTNSENCNATAASAALVGWVRRIPIDRVLHELRHTIKDRLREVQCPKAILDSIAGHASQDVGDGYGKGYSLKVKHEWLQKVALKMI